MTIKYPVLCMWIFGLWNINGCFTEDDCTDPNQLGACMNKKQYVFCQTAAEADLYPNIVMVFCLLGNP